MKLTQTRLHALLLFLVAVSLLPGCTGSGTGTPAGREDSDMQTVWGSGSRSTKPINGPEQDHSEGRR